MAVAGGELREQPLVELGPRPAGDLHESELVVHDAKANGVTARDDTLLAAYLIDPGRASYANLIRALTRSLSPGCNSSPNSSATERIVY